MCRAPAACFGCVQVHVAVVVAVCIVCVCDCDDQMMATEELVPTLVKPVPEQVALKEGGVYPTRWIANGQGKLA